MDCRVAAGSTNTGLQLRHLRSRHSLPTNQEEENQRLEHLQLDQKATTANTPFTLVRGTAIASRKPLDRFDNKILRDCIASF